MKDIKSMNLAELQQAVQALGEPSFRAKQIFVWLHRGVTSFEEMTNLSKPLRQKLADSFQLTAPQVARKQVSQRDGTVKYLWRLADGNCVETVLMRYHHGNTVCISSEVGCAMGCAFCAPGGNAGSGAVHPAGFRPAGVQHCAHGHRGAAG